MRWRIHWTFIGRARSKVPTSTGSQVLKASTQRCAPVPHIGASQLLVHACILVPFRYLKQTTRGRQLLPGIWLSLTSAAEIKLLAPHLAHVKCWQHFTFLLDNTFAYPQITISVVPISPAYCDTCITHRTFDLPHVGTVNS